MYRTKYILSLFIGLKLCGKSEGRKHRKSIPPAYHTPKNRPPGICMPNSKSLTEALLPTTATGNLWVKQQHAERRNVWNSFLTMGDRMVWPPFCHVTV